MICKPVARVAMAGKMSEENVSCLPEVQRCELGSVTAEP